MNSSLQSCIQVSRVFSGSRFATTRTTSSRRRAWMAAARSSFPDFSGTVEVVLGADDRIAGHVIWRRTHRGPFLGLPPSGRAVWINAFHVVRFKSERIAEWWGNADLLGIVNQIGGRIKPSD